jgi:hypothetical protein
MALLPNLAKRLNDIEIAANAPLTESLMRKFGSNINLLLDFLGLADDSNSASGDLSDLVNAISFIQANPFSLQATINPVNALQTNINIGTYTKQKYVNQIFHFAIFNNTGLQYNPSYGIFDAILPNPSPEIYMTNVEFRIDAGSYQAMRPQFFYSPQIRDNYYQRNFSGSSNHRFTRLFPSNVGNNIAQTLGQSIFVGIVNNQFFNVPAFVFDWRDAGTTFQFRADFRIPIQGQIRIYRECRLDVGSLGL